MDASDIAQLAAFLASRAAPRVLALAAADVGGIVDLAAALPPRGELFAFEADPALVAGARARLATAGVADRVHVMLGARDRLLHKVAGPFDLVLADGAALSAGPALTRVRELLMPDGVVIAAGMPDDSGWDTVLLQAGSRLVKSVKR